MKYYDMVNNEVKLNDEVSFDINGETYLGVINYISPDGCIHITSLAGEYRRCPAEVIKLVKKIDEDINPKK